MLKGYHRISCSSRDKKQLVERTRVMVPKSLGVETRSHRTRPGHERHIISSRHIIILKAHIIIVRSHNIT